MMRAFNIISPAVLLFLCSVMTAGAQGSGEGVYYLGEVVVSGTNSVIEQTTTTTTITASDIAEQGARTVDEALELVPGLNIRTANAGTPRIDIRGFRTRNMLLLINGVPINSTLDGQFDPSTLSVDNIAEIRVISGGSGSLLYGPYGNGGIIDIITRAGTKGIQGSVASEAEQRDSYLGRVTLSGASGRVNAFLSSTVTSSTGFPLSGSFESTLSEDGGLRLSSDSKRRNVSANIGFEPDGNTDLGLSIQYRNGEYGIPPVTTDPNDPFTKRAKYDRMDSYAGTAVQLAGSRLFTQTVGIRGWAYVNRLDEEANGYDDATFTSQTRNGTYHKDSSALVSGGNLQIIHDGGEWGTATLGMNGEVLSWEETGFENKNKPSIIDGSRNLNRFSTALEYQMSPLEQLGIVAGAGIHFQQGDVPESDSDFTYLLSAVYHAGETSNFRISHSRKILFPSIRQLFDPFSGSPELKPETTIHYEAGVEQVLPLSSTVELNGFIIDANDFIEKDIDEIYRNHESYRFSGFEVITSTDAVPNLRLEASYSYLHSKDKSPGTEKEELQYRPRDKITFAGRYRFPFEVSLFASLEYLANQYTYTDKEPLMKKRMKDFLICDMRLSKSLLGGRIKGNLGANNLFDEDYEQSYGLPRPGRTLSIGVEYVF